MARTIININNHFDTSAGVHQYAIGGMTPDGVRRQVNEFHMKLYHNGGRVITEKRQKMNGVIYVVFTYEI